ncbi:hypothetical protein CGLO_03655 [Colletotrichum gloeosporioides Cg-14]|uniref:Uncharacterized protein n=1 Tax=Colletotrichum gloeosporioides (strain Cg-14) TaxID=1237896 RepID=T0KW17_COLGC|nr:hypothetical protein CGLO_03655 [Colletotrichum gloeosporioides Cg-14]
MPAAGPHSSIHLFVSPFPTRTSEGFPWWWAVVAAANYYYKSDYAMIDTAVPSIQRP